MAIRIKSNDDGYGYKVQDLSGPKPGKVKPYAQDAWINPQGYFYEVLYGNHCAVARKLGDETGGFRFEQEGWIHFSGGRFDIGPATTSAALETAMEVLAILEAEGHSYAVKARQTLAAGMRFLGEELYS